MGLIWLLSFSLFTATSSLYWMNHNYWGLTGIMAVIISQILVINFWDDARFGTVLNIAILLVIVGSFFRFQ